MSLPCYLSLVMAMPSTGFIRFRGSADVVRVGKIVCLGRNYAEHAKEMGAFPPEKPILFLKPSSAIVCSGGFVFFPLFSNDMHHEVEMVIAIGRKGKSIPRPDALSYIAGYGVGLDMTLRDVQAAAKKQGLPWAVAKGFDTSAPVSEFIPSSSVPDPGNMKISLSVNGQIRQSSNTKQMLFTVPEIVSHVSDVFTLEEGDLIFTGTPEGVGPVVPGDLLHAELDLIASLTVTIVRDPQ